MKWAVVLLIALQATTVLSSERSVYDFGWLDADKEIYVLQNRKFRKKSRVFIGLTGTKTTSGAFVKSFGGMLNGGFFFTENWGLELFYGFKSKSINDTFSSVEDAGVIPFYKSIESMFGGQLLWSPFYAKLNTFNTIIYYDWIFGAGFTSLNLKDNRVAFGPTSNSNRNAEDVEEQATGLTWSTAMRFYLTKMISLKIRFQGYHFQAEDAQGNGGTVQTEKLWFHQYDLGAGINFTF